MHEPCPVFGDEADLGAWSGYQSTRWNGEQAKAGGRSSALRIESAKAAGPANTQLAARAAQRFEAQAEVYAGKVLRNIQRASNYVLGVVLFASSLFFAGMSTNLTAPKLRVAMLTIGCVVFLVTAVWIGTSPVSVSV